MPITIDVRSQYNNIPDDQGMDVYIGTLKEDPEPDNNTEEIITEAFLLLITKNFLIFNMVSTRDLARNTTLSWSNTSQLSSKHTFNPCTFYLLGNFTSP